MLIINSNNEVREEDEERQKNRQISRQVIYLIPIGVEKKNL